MSGMGWEHEPSEADTVWLQGIELQSGGEAGGQMCRFVRDFYPLLASISTLDLSFGHR